MSSAFVLFLAACFLLAGCGGGGGGSSAGGSGGGAVVIPPEPPAPETPSLTVFQSMPGVSFAMVGLSGATGPGGNFRVGDYIAVTFTLSKSNGTPMPPSELNSASMYVSGPTSNYQIVIPRQQNVRGISTPNTDGSWTYTFPVPIPAVYAAPLNDTASFGAADGEMTGLPLLDGTYTVGFEGYKNYLVEKDTFRDPANATIDFKFGTATTLEPREVVKQDNCNACHSELRAHGEFRRDVKLCVLCHTAGAEDRNTASVANGTPGASIDFKVMIHKIHNGIHLPSVNGIGVNTDGTRNYAATATPYQLIGFNNTLIDFSHVAFPVWPNFTIAMPRNFGYTALSTTAKAQDDVIRKGTTDCAKCHGDPDGAGPLTAPTQGDHYHLNPSRAACGSCHDDIDWSKPYTKNLFPMPPQADDSACTNCHAETGSGVIPTVDSHIHPLKRPAFNPGLNVEITSVAEAGNHNGDGNLDPGEKVAVTLTIEDDLGNAVAPSALASLNCIINGPTTNRHLLNTTGVPLALLGTGPTITFNVPQLVQTEFVGTSTSGIDTFTTARSPHINLTSFLTQVFVRTATGISTNTTAALTVAQNFIDVASSSGILKDAYVVVDDGLATEEYLRVQWVDGNRLWFSSPQSTSYTISTRFAHPAGSVVKVVTIATKTVTTDFTVNAAAGTITEVTEFGTGNKVLVTYSTEFVMPSFYPVPINGTEGIDESGADWNRKSLVSGTYTLGIYTTRSLVLNEFNETQTYRGTAPSATKDFLVGTATAIERNDIISSAANCNSCHNEIYFHGGGRRGYDTCLLCHGTVGFEDRPRFLAPNAPETPSASFEFRDLVHTLHTGKELQDRFEPYIVNGSAAYPNNWSNLTYENVGFPSKPGGTKNCRACHGDTSTSWIEPQPRNHPTEQVVPAQVWRVVCNSCHNGPDATAHIQANTAPSGAESCGVCHTTGGVASVETFHKGR